ncbi:hypothetical protein ARMA_0156 [Ardenticatena maritima]|uniref:Ribbon-helix-helix protein CopG domain-containing protein n=1 Tax=Ardenticatena maritima TaxID=872965 RepID=A0A0M8K4X6_9CHLR|nr:type II toxin-antitoxin system VapB family antitoxin [Ardenticatena maritima]KPL87965.1 hypothetical protein SE16_10615 [Ardenticatena maritima]GAP61733.1 hypothetical protein ARMA_0156 [Ardenticatena maritima]
MPIIIENLEVETLLNAAAQRSGRKKTEIMRDALQLYLAHHSTRIPSQQRLALWYAFLEDEIWPHIPQEQQGRAPSKAEREAILGYGEEGA